MQTVPHPLTSIYSIVDPRGEKITGTTTRPVSEIIGDHLEDVEITLRRSDRSDSEVTEKQILKLFNNAERDAYSFPIWNIARGVEVAGTLKYKNGKEGKFAIAGHKVGFHDQSGQAWYFEWDEKHPSRNMP